MEFNTFSSPAGLKNSKGEMKTSTLVAIWSQGGWDGWGSDSDDDHLWGAPTPILPGCSHCSDPETSVPTGHTFMQLGPDSENVSTMTKGITAILNIKHFEPPFLT